MVYRFNKLYSYIQPFIKIHLLDCLKLRLNILLKTGLYYIKKTVKADNDIQKVRFGCVQQAVSFTILFVLLSVVFFVKRLLLHYYWIEKALIYK